MTRNCNECLESFRALSDDIRLAIIEKLARQELCACELLETLELDIAQSSLSYHMKILTDAELILAKREGKWIRYSLNSSKFKQIQKYLGELL